MTDYATHHFKAASDFTVSVGYDRRLAPFDIDASVAHARMLGAQGVIPASDAEAIVRGLAALRVEVERGDFPWRDEFEDVHMNIERRLAETIGEPAARLHTARSRNDQVAAATRLYARSAIDEAARAIRAVQRALVDKAEAHASALMPGYTHLQRAQPLLFAHHLLAYFEALERDAARLADCRRRVNVSPLGSGALAGVPYPIDRETVAAELGFDAVSANSMDAVSDRDYLAELLAAAAVCMTHLSRLAEDVVLWTSQEFGFASLGAEWVTGSSMMPQKRNPDFAELARGKTGRVYGNLMALLTVLKGLPMTYNRDLQEDKEPLFDTMDTLLAALEAFRGMLGSLRVDEARMAQAASDPRDARHRPGRLPRGQGRPVPRGPRRRQRSHRNRDRAQHHPRATAPGRLPRAPPRVRPRRVRTDRRAQRRRPRRARRHGARTRRRRHRRRQAPPRGRFSKK